MHVYMWSYFLCDRKYSFLSVHCSNVDQTIYEIKINKIVKMYIIHQDWMSVIFFHSFKVTLEENIKEISI